MRTRYFETFMARRVEGGQVTSAGARQRGAGFTVVRNGVGNYTVTFLRHFRADPSVELYQSGGGSTPGLQEVSTRHIRVQTVDLGGNATDLGFTFQAVE